MERRCRSFGQAWAADPGRQLTQYGAMSGAVDQVPMKDTMLRQAVP